jgi:hypothetical protein
MYHRDRKLSKRVGLEHCVKKAHIKRGSQRYAGSLGTRESQTNSRPAVYAFQMYIAYGHSSLRVITAGVVLSKLEASTRRADKLDRSSIAGIL